MTADRKNMTSFPRKPVALLALLLAAFAARTVCMSLMPLTDPTEGRYAQIAQEMTDSGDWVTPRLWMDGTHVPFLGKPPLFFWSAAAAMRLFGTNEFSARLPSMLATALILFLLFRVMNRYGDGTGLPSVLLTASCCFFFAVSGIVAVDLLLSLCVAGSLLSYFAFLNEPDLAPRRRWSLLTFLLLALGFLTKGPVSLLMFGLPVFFWTLRWKAWRDLRIHAWLCGTLLFAVLVIPWFALCEVRNPGFLKYFFVNENLLRFITPNYGDAYGSGHVYPHGSALWMFLAAAAPWSLYPLWKLLRREYPRRALASADRPTSFLFLGFATGILFWCFARQLLITYMLPMVPLFAAWMAFTLRHDQPTSQRISKHALRLITVMGCLSLFLSPFIETYTTASARKLIRFSRADALRQTPDEPLVFAFRTPYSAFFYDRDRVLPHPDEPLPQTLARCRNLYPTALVALREKDQSQLQTIPPDSITPLAAFGHWRLMRLSLRPSQRSKPHPAP